MNYSAHYDRLIERARSRVLVCYRERHHVVPRCMDGDDSLANIVELTAEEHYVAHQLLVKMYPCHRGLAYSAVRMAKQCTGNKPYGWLRRQLALARKGVPLSPEHRANIGAAFRGKQKSPEHRAKISVALRGKQNCLGRKVSAGSRAKMSASMRGRIISPEHRAKISVAQRGIPNSPEHRAKLSASRLGKKHSPETRARISAGQLGKKRAPLSLEARSKVSRGLLRAYREGRR